MKLTKRNITNVILICLTLYYTIMYSNSFLFEKMGTYLIPILFICNFMILIINFKEISQKSGLIIMIFGLCVLNIILTRFYTGNRNG